MGKVHLGFLEFFFVTEDETEAEDGPAEVEAPIVFIVFFN